MTATVQDKPWDLSHVLDLVNTLHPHPSDRPRSDGKDYQLHSTGVEDNGLLTPLQGLGDFSRIFQYLGTPIHSPTPSLAVKTPRGHDADEYIHVKDDYASDGATYFKIFGNHNRAAQPQEDNNIAEEATDTVSDGSAVPNTPTLTKTQRKKKNRRERRAREAALSARHSTKVAPVSVSESEADVSSKKAPARKASAHVLPTTPKPLYKLRPRDVSGKATTADSKGPVHNAIDGGIQKVDAAKMAQSVASVDGSDATSSKSAAAVVEPITAEQTYSTLTSLKRGDLAAPSAAKTKSTQPLPPSSFNAGATKFLPSTVQPPSHSAAKLNSLAPHPTPTQSSAPAKPARMIEPIVVRSGEDRHWALLMKLIGDFYEDRKYLIAPMNLTTHNNNPKGIHVFVDASNIFIGFNEQLKRSRGIPPWIQVPAVDLSFDALALLMERRRPVAKRVLAGSMPYLPAFDKAKAVGYECSILEKVYKARELTERQVYFKELDRVRCRHGAKAPPANNVATANGIASSSGSGSGSETNAPQYAPARMIEQGVDEILHLKILESVVDTDVPGTIVLATGDAAQAEYSQGFMAMAERALKKGWTVELVSWSKTISAMYTRREWVQTWGERFKIVTLDDYAEELLDM